MDIVDKTLPTILKIALGGFIVYNIVKTVKSNCECDRDEDIDKEIDVVSEIFTIKQKKFLLL